jgi:serine/threonine protein kinase
MHAGTCPQATGRLLYAPPEDVVAVEQGQVATKATASGDVWALGIIAFECLTRTRVFPPDATEKRIRDGLTGRHSLPWERMDPQSLECMNRLKEFRRSVLMCLDRNPANRPRASQVRAHASPKPSNPLKTLIHHPCQRKILMHASNLLMHATFRKFVCI